MHDDHDEAPPPDNPRMVDELRQAEIALDHGDDRTAEARIEEVIEELKHPQGGHGGHVPVGPFPLIVNRAPKEWPKEMIRGEEIRTLSGSPGDWIVNQIVEGAGDDPEIAPHQEVHLDEKSPPKGVKKFIVRKPKTSPGAR